MENRSRSVLFTFIIDITVPPSQSDHLLHHLLPQILPQVGHHQTQLVDTDKAVAVLVEHLEGFSDLFLAVCVLHLAGHHDEKLCEVNGAVTVSVHLIDHILELGLRGVHTQRSQDLRDIQYKSVC